MRDEEPPHPHCALSALLDMAQLFKSKPVKRFLFPWFYLFNVEEVLGIEGDGSAGDRNIFIQSPTVTHVGLDSKCYWFGLQTEKKPHQKHWGLFIQKKSSPNNFTQASREFSSLENIPI